MARTQAGGISEAEVQNATYTYAADAEASDTYAITLPKAPAAYVAGQQFAFKANTANTGAATLNVNGLGAKTIKKRTGVDLADNDIKSGSIVEVRYDGTYFQMVSMLGNAPAGSGDMTAAVYDPTAVTGDAFDMANMVEAADAKVLTAAERTILGNTSGANTGDEVDANATTKGIVELATTAEVDTGTDATRAITPDALNGASPAVATTNMTEGTDKNFVTDAEATVIGNTSGTNTGDEDTASITALGALMDSEVTNLAQVKAFDSTDYATAAQGSTADAALPKAGGTMTGDIALGTAVTDTSSIKLNNAALSDEKWSGTTIVATAGETIAVGDLCYLKTADGEWYKTDGILDGTDTAFALKLGVCVAAGTDGNPTEVLLDGVIASAAFPAFTVGAPVYMSDTAGDMVVAQPSTTNFAIRVVGYAVSATVLHFQPSNDYIVHV